MLLSEDHQGCILTHGCGQHDPRCHWQIDTQTPNHDAVNITHSTQSNTEEACWCSVLLCSVSQKNYVMRNTTWILAHTHQTFFFCNPPCAHFNKMPKTKMHHMSCTWATCSGETQCDAVSTSPDIITWLGLKVRSLWEMLQMLTLFSLTESSMNCSPLVF